VPPFVRDDVLVSGSIEDDQIGPREWRLQLAPDVDADDDTPEELFTDVSGCAFAAPGPYTCSWDTRAHPDGRYEVRARLTDLMTDKHVNVGDTRVRTTIDHTPPSMDVSGELKDAEDQRPLYEDAVGGLHVSASDAGSGVVRVEVIVDGATRSARDQACANGGCGIEHDYELAGREYVDGQHEVRVIARDQVGYTTERVWTVDVEQEIPEAEQATPAGSATSGAFPVPGSAAALSEARLAAEAGVPSLARFEAGNELLYNLPCTSEEEPANFAVWSLGSNFEGLALDAVTRRCDTPSPVEPIRANYVNHIYGTCSPDPGEEEASCVPPLQIQSWPGCERSLWSYDIGPEPFQIAYVDTTLRGVPAAIFGDDRLRVEVFTGGSTIVLFGQDPDQLLRAVDALRQEPGGGELDGLLPAPPGGALAPPLGGALTGTLQCR
jgi:hypothetical protein